ncbi:hypothetical protein SAMN05421869_13539 [Nonomuraea jiangxiensis]|uniref:Uncharacterized protein n=1 Tax=Nonomuraea jiangxiensis TaxID=633440 RepID=A0A1G9Q3I1_9ACTN|nr:hypothetical protein SAMN05421869_13539 [Nonomuraea jiangxiensis]
MPDATDNCAEGPLLPAQSLSNCMDRRADQLAGSQRLGADVEAADLNQVFSVKLEAVAKPQVIGREPGLRSYTIRSAQER